MSSLLEDRRQTRIDTEKSGRKKKTKRVRNRMNYIIHSIGRGTVQINVTDRVTRKISQIAEESTAKKKMKKERKTREEVSSFSFLFFDFTRQELTPRVFFFHEIRQEKRERQRET